MNRHEFLTALHAVYQPRTYLEIGVNDGRSLALSRVPSIGVDPAFKVTAEVSCDVQLARATSDDFFARPAPIAHFAGLPVDLAFIDGLHLFEYALRDFMNVERLASPGSVIVFDDMLPRDVDEAARDRHTRFWAGDVYKVVSVLRQYRPDLICLPVNTTPTGLLVVLDPDPSNRVLHENYQAIEAEHVVPDPQVVPAGILSRETAVNPHLLLGAAFWPALVRARNKGRFRSRARARLHRRIVGDVPAPRPAVSAPPTVTAR